MLKLHVPEPMFAYLKSKLTGVARPIFCLSQKMKLTGVDQRSYVHIPRKAEAVGGSATTGCRVAEAG